MNEKYHERQDWYENALLVSIFEERKKDDERDRRYDKGSKKSTQRSTTVEAYSYLKCAKEDLQPPQPPNKTTTILHSVGIYHSTNLSPSFNPCQQACFAINMTPMLQYGAQKDAALVATPFLFPLAIDWSSAEAFKPDQCFPMIRILLCLCFHSC